MSLSYDLKLSQIYFFLDKRFSRNQKLSYDPKDEVFPK